MKRFTTLMLGTALATALSFAAQSTPAPATNQPATSAPAKTSMKKHAKKHAKKVNGAASTTNATPDTNAPVKK